MALSKTATGGEAARRPVGRSPFRLWPSIKAAHIWREPLLHFLLLGALIFAAAQWHNHADDPHRILIDRSLVSRLAQAYADQYGQQPSAAAMNELINRYVEQEALYREGKAMGLDQDDEVVRRRIIQKTQFLRQDLRPPAEPDEAALSRYYRTHAARYVTPARVTFSHIYFSADGGDAAARDRAAAVLATLPAGLTRAPGRGDAFPDLYDYAGLSAEDVGRVFGRSELSAELFKAPVGRWVGPFRSGYGWHLIRVSSMTEPVRRPLAAILDAVRADYLADARAEADRTSMAELRSRYEVVIAEGARL